MNILSIAATYILSILFGYIILTKYFKTVPLNKLTPFLFIPVILAWIMGRAKIVSIFDFTIWFSHFMIGLAAGLLLGYIVQKVNKKRTSVKEANV